MPSDEEVTQRAGSGRAMTGLTPESSQHSCRMSNTDFWPLWEATFLMDNRAPTAAAVRMTPLRYP